MPNERRHHSVSTEKSGASPYKCSSSTSHQKKALLKTPSENKENLKEWEEARCPVCMEHPHNAILLLCSSHNNNCRPYICDTSSRHSNCFDQFRKSPESNLVCPLCRGRVIGSVVVEPARELMNKKSRTCASETCEFSGTYADLKKHAKVVHPRVRPSQADPGREREWERLERERDVGDLLSTLESSRSMSMGDDGIEDRRARVVAGLLTTIQLAMPSSMSMLMSMEDDGNEDGGRTLVISFSRSQNGSRDSRARAR